MNRDTFLEFIGLVFDTGIVLENELEIGRRTCLDKVDKDFYATAIKSASKRWAVPYTFQVNVSGNETVSNLELQQKLTTVTGTDRPFRPILFNLKTKGGLGLCWRNSGATRGDRTHARPDRCHGDVLLL